MEAIRQAVLKTLRAGHPMTVRQLFYRLVAQGVIAKTEQEYNGTVCRLAAEMRRAGDIPYSWLADSTRWQRKPRTHSSVEELLEDAARTYRRALWDDQGDYVEVWLEKEALAGVLYQVTAKWDVPLMVTRGYPSLSYLYEAGYAIREIDRPTTLYYLGDHDPSGVDIPRVVEAGIREFAPEVELRFVRLAVTPEQIEELGLPTRPTKTTDSRAKGFQGGSIEVDAIQPAILRALVEEAIVSHLDLDALARTKAFEQAERDTLRQMAEGGGE